MTGSGFSRSVTGSGFSRSVTGSGFSRSVTAVTGSGFNRSVTAVTGSGFNRSVTTYYGPIFSTQFIHSFNLLGAIWCRRRGLDTSIWFCLLLPWWMSEGSVLCWSVQDRSLIQIVYTWNLKGQSSAGQYRTDH